MAATVALLLLELAGPYSLSAVDLGLVRRWANSWAPLVSLQPPVAGEPLPALVVDLMHDGGLRSPVGGQVSDHVRRLETSRLAMQISCEGVGHLAHDRQGSGRQPAGRKALCRGRCSRLRC